jgi:pyruvate,water dikinase
MPEHLDLTRDGVEPRAWAPRSRRASRGVSPGVATGRMITPGEEPASGPYVLVCASADADVAPMLPFVDGVLSERGSELSHIAILSREYQIPCVVGYTGATALTPGSTVSINGTTGEVTIYDQQQ